MPGGTDARTLTKTGPGTLIIANDSTATALHVTAGRCTALKHTGMAAATGTVIIAAGATAEYQVTGTNTTTANTVTAAAAALGTAATTALSIDSSRVLLSSPVSALGAVTMNAGATLGFIPSAGNYKRATLSSLTGGGTLHLNANLGLGRADLLTIDTAPRGDYLLIISNTGTPTGFTTPITLVNAPDAPPTPTPPASPPPSSATPACIPTKSTPATTTAPSPCKLPAPVRSATRAASSTPLPARSPSAGSPN
jgi:hypothetical protein